MSGRHRDDMPGETPGGGGYDTGGRPVFGPRESSGNADWFTPRDARGEQDPSGGAGAGRPDDSGAPQWFAPREPADPGARPGAGGGPYGSPGQGAGPGGAGGPGRPAGSGGAGSFTGASDAGGHGLGREAGRASYPGSGGGYSAGGYSASGSGGDPRASSGPYESLSSSSDGYDSLSDRSSGNQPYGPGGSGGSGDSGGYGSGGYGSGGSGGYGSGGYGSGGYGSGEYGRRKKRSTAALIGPLAGAVGLALLLGVGVYAFAQGGGCSDGDAVNLSLTTSPEISPAVTAAVSRFNDQKRKVNGHCVKASVASADPAAVTTLLSGQGVSSGASKRPDVWIPDTSLWLDVIKSTTKGKVQLTASKTSVAQTPIVVAVPRTLALKLRSSGVISNPSWDNLLSAAGGTVGGAVTKNQIIPPGLIRLSVTDPIRNGAGMTTLVATQLLLTNDPNARTIFTGIVRTMREATTSNVQTQMAAFKRQATGRFPVALVPEQSVWKHNAGAPAEPAVAIYPSEGTLNLDYPMTVTAQSPDKVAAAKLLEQALSTDTTRNDIRRLGFRTTDGKAPSTFGVKTGVNPERPRQLPSPKSDSVETVLQAWSKLSLGIRMLTLMDVSGSMADKVPGTKGVTRMAATTQIAQGGLSLMPDDTELGLWTFSTNMVGKRPWREDVPVGPLGDRIGSSTRRQTLLTGMAGLRPIPTGDTGLYDTVLAAFKYMKRTYKPEEINSILLLTDGKNDNPGGLTLKQVLSALQQEYDPTKPVQVMMIGFGQGVDVNELNKIAKVTHGSVSVANTPEEIQKIFLAALSRRICTPNC